MIPREHGAWMMLYAPFLIGAARGGVWGSGVLWALLLVSGGYCAREPLSVWFTRKNRRSAASRWFAGFAGLAFVGAAGLATHERRVELATLTLLGGALFLTHFTLERRREHRGFTGELLGVAGLTLTAPLGYFAAEGTDRTWAILLWFLNLLYFGSSIVYVKWRVARLVAERRGESSRQGLGALIGYHAVLLVAVVGLAVVDVVSGWVFVAFAPLAFRYGLRAVVRQTPTLTQVGISEIVLSLAFVAAMLRVV
jgi:hypothetical protein